PRGERPQTNRFNKLLDDAASGESKDVITEMVLRTQAQAVYDTENIGHFGLNLTKYAHFTSPIRRYADLIVHRALIKALKLGPEGLSTEREVQLEETAEHISTTERRSMAAERDATDRYLAHYMSDHVGAEFEGRITGLSKAGLFVRLGVTGADGLVPISRLSDEYWVLDEKTRALVARGSGRRFEMGQDVTVRLEEATPLTGGLLLEMLSKPKPRRKDLNASKSKGRDRPSGRPARTKGRKRGR
ncbi:MAG: RNB domain-containing ribonuclease, partial [Pseudomonadota bacterium]